MDLLEMTLQIGNDNMTISYFLSFVPEPAAVMSVPWDVQYGGNHRPPAEL